MKCSECKKTVYRYKLDKGAATCLRCYVPEDTRRTIKQGGVTAILYDNAGVGYAVDKKGNHIPKDQHPYRPKQDRNAWKYAGKVKK